MINQELTPQQIARSSLLSYVGLHYPKYIAEPMHKLIATALENVECGKIKRLLIFAPPQHGKPAWEEEPVLMGDGSYKKLKDIKVGDHVITHKRRAKKVTAVYKQGLLPTVQLNTSYGMNPCTALDHPFLTPNGWIKAGDLQIKDTLAVINNTNIIPTTKKSISEFIVAGYLIGDGCTAPIGNSCHATMTIDDSSEIAFDFIAHSEALNFVVKRKVYTNNNTPRYTMSSGIDKNGNNCSPRKWIIENDLCHKSHGKHIPNWVYTASDEKVAALIGAYFACDGHVGKRDKIRTDCYCEFYSVSLQLLQDVQNLLLRFGIISKIAVKNGTIFGRPHKSWRLTINNVNDLIQFQESIRLEGIKAKTFAEWPLHRNQFSTEYIPNQIIGIENTGMRKCRCLMVEDDHTFTIQNIVIHNSMLASEFFPPWVIGRHPDWKIIAATFNQTRANEVGTVVRDVLRGSIHKTVFPDCEISKDVQSSQHVGTTNRGHYYSIGLSGTGTGRGSNIFLIDDPFKGREDAESKLGREKVKEFYKSVAYSRLRPGGRIIIINTRWQLDDLSGYVLKEFPFENWKIIDLKAIAEVGDVLGRKPGEPLCPHIYPLEELEKMKMVQGTYNWESLYQQRPIPREGGLIKYEWIEDNWYDEIPEDKVIKTVISWDTAFRKDDLKDPTAASVWKITQNGYYLVHVFNKQLAFHQIIQKIKELHSEYHPSVHLIEGRASGQPIIDEVKRLTTIPVVEVSTNNLDKEVRLGSVSGLFESGKVHFPERAPWLIEAKDQLCLFPSYKYDDIVDSVTHFLRWVNKPRYVRRPPSKLYWK